MYALLAVIVAALCVACCMAWLRANRSSRRRWLQRLDLPGRWDWEGGTGVLELAGTLDRGQYRIEEAGVEEQGSWQLEGHDLVLCPQGGSRSALDLRLFTEGRIGVHGPGRERRIYVKRRGNVVPLRRHGS